MTPFCLSTPEPTPFFAVVPSPTTTRGLGRPLIKDNGHYHRVIKGRLRSIAAFTGSATRVSLLVTPGFFRDCQLLHRTPLVDLLSREAKLPFWNSVAILRNSSPLGCLGGEPFDDDGQTPGSIGFEWSSQAAREMTWTGKSANPTTSTPTIGNHGQPQRNEWAVAHRPKSANTFRTRPRVPCLANSPPSPVLVNCTAGKDSKCALPSFILSKPLLHSKQQTPLILSLCGLPPPPPPCPF